MAHDEEHRLPVLGFAIGMNAVKIEEAIKVKFLLTTDGVNLEAEDLVSDEPPIACNYPDFIGTIKNFVYGCAV